MTNTKDGFAFYDMPLLLVSIGTIHLASVLPPFLDH